MERNIYFKLVCETVTPLEKTVDIDVNLRSLDDVHDYMSKHSELLSADRTWIIYPMPICK